MGITTDGEGSVVNSWLREGDVNVFEGRMCGERAQEGGYGKDQCNADDDRFRPAF